MRKQCIIPIKLTMANPVQSMLNPGKWNGAFSERKRAARSEEAFQGAFIPKRCDLIHSDFITIFIYLLQSPVSGEKTKGDTTLAKEHIPEMQPCAFPWTRRSFNCRSNISWWTRNAWMVKHPHSTILATHITFKESTSWRIIAHYQTDFKSQNYQWDLFVFYHSSKQW